MKYLIPLLFLIGCGNGESEPTAEPTIEPTSVYQEKCITVKIVHIPINPNDWIYIDGIYSLTYTDNVDAQESNFEGHKTSSGIVTITNGSATIDVYALGSFLFTVDAGYISNDNLEITIEELHGSIVNYHYEYNDEACVL